MSSGTVSLPCWKGKYLNTTLSAGPPREEVSRTAAHKSAERKSKIHRALFQRM